MSFRTTIVMTLVLASIGIVPASAATAGGPDPTFGRGDGWVAKYPTVRGEWWNAPDVAVQPNGRIVLAANLGNDFGVVRLLSDGLPDRSFGDDHGRAIISVRDSRSLSGGLALMPDGRIVVVGSLVRPTDEDTELIVARLLPSGQPDPSFSRNGRLVVADPSGEPIGGGDIAVLADGDVVVATGPSVVKVTSSGHLDSSFGDGGFAPHRTQALGLLDGGRIAIADVPLASSGQPSDRWRLRRLLADGTLDRSFGVDGEASVAWTRNTSVDGLLMQPDGRIVAVGSARERPSSDGFLSAFARFTPSGTLDDTFGGDGKRRPFVEGYGFAAASTDRFIYAAGPWRGVTNIVRLHIGDGGIDRRFGEAGVVSFRPGSISQFQAEALAIDTAGRVVISAFVVREDRPKLPGYGVARFLP